MTTTSTKAMVPAKKYGIISTPQVAPPVPPSRRWRRDHLHRKNLSTTPPRRSVLLLSVVPLLLVLAQQYYGNRHCHFLPLANAQDASAEIEITPDGREEETVVVEAPSCQNDTTDGTTTGGHQPPNLDPNLHPILFDESDEPSYVYIRPPVETYYRSDWDKGGKEIDPQFQGKREYTPSFNGLAGRFTNLSPDDKLLVWVPPSGGPTVYIAYVPAFETGGTATFPGHVFCFTPTTNQEECEYRMTVQSTISRYTYDPYRHYNTEISHEGRKYKGNPSEVLNPTQLEKYHKNIQTEKYNEKYRDMTGRDFLAMYPKKRPSFYMYPAEYYGQIHTVTTKETYFDKQLPSKEDVPEMGRIKSIGRARRLNDDEPRLLNEYRHPDPTLTLKLEVLSVSPRVYRIDNFLSNIEVDHILNIASKSQLGVSTVSGRDGDGKQSDTRTSRNTWLDRETSPVVDTVYRRAADLLRIDEALLRHRDETEFTEIPSRSTIAESLQLVHYQDGQEYTAHHDFGYPKTLDPIQPTRFATLLLYLNEGMVGGETAFPRWVNAHTSGALEVTPKKGTAVLFYSLLPDGNMDDLSQHAARPVTKGEKWLTNLWVHEPIYER